MNRTVITYYSTLYKKVLEDLVTGEIEFKNGMVTYASGGHRYARRVENIISIRPAE